LLPSIYSGENAVWVCGPDEGFWLGICFLNEAVDGGLKIDDGPEDASFKSPLRELGEEALNGIEP